MMQIIDQSDLRHYRHEIPNIVDDMGLSPYAYRLYGHLKRRAGDGGYCNEGVRGMAKHCNMSPPSIINAKKELLDRGLITIVRGDTAKSIPDTIYIVNIWQQNLKTFQKQNPAKTDKDPCSPIEHPVHLLNTPCSPIEHPVHQIEHKKEPKSLPTVKTAAKNAAALPAPVSAEGVDWKSIGAERTRMLAALKAIVGALPAPDAERAACNWLLKNREALSATTEDFIACLHEQAAEVEDGGWRRRVSWQTVKTEFPAWQLRARPKTRARASPAAETREQKEARLKAKLFGGRHANSAT